MSTITKRIAFDVALDDGRKFRLAYQVLKSDVTGLSDSYYGIRIFDLTTNLTVWTTIIPNSVSIARAVKDAIVEYADYLEACAILEQYGY